MPNAFGDFHHKGGNAKSKLGPPPSLAKTEQDLQLPKPQILTAGPPMIPAKIVSPFGYTPTKYPQNSSLDKYGVESPFGSGTNVPPVVSSTTCTSAGVAYYSTSNTMVHESPSKETNDSIEQNAKLKELLDKLPQHFRSTFVNLESLSCESLERILSLVGSKERSIKDAERPVVGLDERTNSPTTNVDKPSIGRNQWVPEPYVPNPPSMDPMFFVAENVYRSLRCLDENKARVALEERWKSELGVVAPALMQKAEAQKLENFERKRKKKMMRLEKEYQCRIFWEAQQRQEELEREEQMKLKAEQERNAQIRHITKLRRNMYDFSG